MSEFGEDNPRFIAYVNMLDVLADKGIINRNPDNKDHILIYYTDLPPNATKEGISEGWITQNIFDVAEDLFHDIETREALFSVLREQGIEPVFNSYGDFDYLKETEKGREIE